MKTTFFQSTIIALTFVAIPCLGSAQAGTSVYTQRYNECMTTLGYPVE